MEESIPKHIAIIMDGNRRWARNKNIPTQLGHNQGAKTLEEIAKVCEEKGVQYLTVFAFSTENWNRSKEEVDHLMELLAKNISDFDKRFNNREVRIRMLGNRDGLPEKLQKGISEIEERTKNKKDLTVNIAINYGGRAEIIQATKRIAEDIKNGKISEVEEINEALLTKYMYT